MKCKQNFLSVVDRFPLYSLSLTGIALVIVATIMPSSQLPDFPSPAGLDKAVHFLMFGLLSAAFVFDEGRRCNSIDVRLWLLSMMVATALGALTECVQGAMAAGRSFDVADILADALGAAIFPLLVWRILQKVIAMYDLQLKPLRRQCVDLEFVRQLYVDSFPVEERRPWDDLIAKLSSTDSPYEILRIYSRGVMVGFISWWDLGAVRYIEHFAIDNSRRGSGIGSKAIKSFVAMSSKPVVLEVEPPEDSQLAARRIEFYKRNGFRLHESFDYTQPPYSPELPSVDLRLMTATAADVDLQDAANRIHRIVYGV